MTKKWAEDLNRHSQKNTNRSSNKYVERSSTLLVIVVQLCLTLCNPMDCSMPGPPCSSPSPGTCSNSCPLSQWCHPTILSSVVPFSCLLSFPASGSFPMSQLFASGGQRIGASAPAPEAGETADTTMLALKTEAASQGMQAASPSGKRQGHWFPLDSPEGRRPC